MAAVFVIKIRVLKKDMDEKRWFKVFSPMQCKAFETASSVAIVADDTKEL